MSFVINPYRFGAGAACTGTAWDGYGASSVKEIGATFSLNAASDASLDDIWDGGATVSIWVYIESDGAGNTGRIFDKRTNIDGSAGWFLLTLNEAAGECDLRFNQDFSTTAHRVITTDPITLNAWHHVAVSYNSDSSANSAIIYIDGTKLEVGSGLTEELTASGTRTSDAARSFLIGNTDFSFIRNFDGSVCECRVYDSILDDATITCLSSGHDEATGLVSYWRLNSVENANYLIDEVGSNNLTATAAASNTDGPAD